MAHLHSLVFALLLDKWGRPSPRIGLPSLAPTVGVGRAWCTLVRCRPHHTGKVLAFTGPSRQPNYMAESTSHITVSRCPQSGIAQPTIWWVCASIMGVGQA